MAINSKALFVPNALVSLVAGPWSTCLEADHACSAWGYRGGSGWGSVRRLRHKWLQQRHLQHTIQKLDFPKAWFEGRDHAAPRGVVLESIGILHWSWNVDLTVLLSICRQTYNPEVRAISWSWSPGVCRRLELEALPFEDHRCLIFQIQLGFVVNFEWSLVSFDSGVFCWVPSFTLSLSDSWISRNNWGGMRGVVYHRSLLYPSLIKRRQTWKSSDWWQFWETFVTTSWTSFPLRRGPLNLALVISRQVEGDLNSIQHLMGRVIKMNKMIVKSVSC